MVSKAKTRKTKAKSPGHAADPLESIRRDVAKANPTPQNLATARQGLRGVAESAEEALLPEVARCARLVADLLEISECVPESARANSDAGASRDPKELSLSGIDALQRMLAEGPDAQAQITQFEQAARADWGEYLALSTNNSESRNPDAAAPSVLVSDAGDPVGESPEGPSAVDMKKVLAALGSLPPLEADAGNVRGKEKKTTRRASQNTKGSRIPVPVPPDKPVPLDIDPGILEAFLEDGGRCLAAMEQAVLRFEAEPTSHEPLVQVCRELHTLKGATSSVGLSELASYLHQVEDFAEACQSREAASVDVEPMLRAVDAVRDQVDALGGSSDASSAVSQGASGAAPAVRRASPQRLHVAPAPSGESSLRVEGSRIDRLLDLLAELVTLRNARDNRLAHLREISAELARCAGRIRAAGDVRVPVGANTRLEESESNGFTEGKWADPLWQNASSSSAGGSLLTEIASDVSELARSLRAHEEPLSQDNQVVSRLIGQFRHELIDLRRVPVMGLFRRLERPARDAARSEGKQVKLVFVGEQSRIERSLEESAYEPLLHLVRNAVSHGIEMPEERRRAGKSPVGTLTLEARSSPSLLVLEVRDDGCGIDYKSLERRGHEKGLLPQAGPVSKHELLRLIFHPGFTTRKTVSEVSGRGIGMDVVARSIERMGGHVDVDSVPGSGTTLRLSIPLRAGIEHAMLVRVAGQIFGLPLHHVDAASEAPPSTVSRDSDVATEGPETRRVRMRELLGLRPSAGNVDEGRLILNLGELAPSEKDPVDDEKTEPGVMRRTRKFPLSVDAVIGPEEVVVRSLPPLLRGSKLFSGVTLSATGEIVLLFNVPRLIALHQELVEKGEQSRETAKTNLADPSRLRVLLVDDSLSARRGLAQTFKGWGFSVEEGADGLEALEMLRNHTYDLVLTDLEMPKLGGLELLAETKRRHQTRHVPVLIMTGRTDEASRKRARELGADGYLTKPVSPTVLSEALADLHLLKSIEQLPSRSAGGGQADTE